MTFNIDMILIFFKILTYMIIIVQSGKIRLVSTVTGIVAIHEFHVWQLVGRLVAFTTSLLITPLAYVMVGKSLSCL